MKSLRAVEGRISLQERTQELQAFSVQCKIIICKQKQKQRLQQTNSDREKDVDRN